MNRDIPDSRDLVLIGGGHTHALLLRMWGMRPLPGVRVTLITPDPVAEYSGMLPGHVAGLYRREDIEIDLVRLARHAGGRLVLDRAAGLDLTARQVLLERRPPVAFDIASVDIGVTTGPSDLPGFAEHVLSVKPAFRFVDGWQRFASEGGGRLVIVGGGLAGVETALAARRRLPAAPITVVEAGPLALREVSSRARRLVLARAEAAGIRIICGCAVVRVHRNAVDLADGRVLAADLVIGASGGQVAGWLGGTGLGMQEDRLRVDTGLVTSDPAVFGVGDCAVLADAPRPQAGVFAVRQAPVLDRNLRVALSGTGRMRAFRPQRDWLRLIAAGGDAVADKWGIGLGGGWVWRWKDRIDRRFMAVMRDLPVMPVPALPRQIAAGAREAMGDKPLCGGCGAKMGRAALRRVLEAVPAPARPDILTGPGDDAAVMMTGGQRQVLTTDHLRALVSDPALMARIAALHALGDIRAMGARAQSALIQITLPRLSEALQERMLTEIMQAAAPVLNRAGAPIIGGHSSTGAELTIGFSLTGLADDPIGQRARAGDLLVLTKPIGSGVLMAAEMQKAATGRAVGAAWDWMARDQHAAAAVLAGGAGPRARAMTDVTGFGLAGHLAGMAEASDATMAVDLDAVPLLPQAEALSAAGQHSSLYATNRAAVLGMVNHLPDTARGRLMFDPQTSGGLLAALAPNEAGAITDAIRAAGDQVWVIGRVEAGTARLRFDCGEAATGEAVSPAP